MRLEEEEKKNKKKKKEYGKLPQEVREQIEAGNIMARSRTRLRPVGAPAHSYSIIIDNRFHMLNDTFNRIARVQSKIDGGNRFDGQNILFR